LMKYKTRDYWYGDGAPDDAGHFAFNFTGTGEEANEKHRAHVESTAKVLAYARETQAPLYPGKLNPDLVKQGADLFHGRTEPADESSFRTCADCHGTYTRKDGFPDLSESGHWAVKYSGSEKLRSVGTDKAYNEVVRKFDPINTHISKLAEYHSARGTDELATNYAPLKGKGYVPPPLVGVWATAPYFHNGSVPTINTVLNSKERPEIWERDPSSHAYGLDPVGLVYAELSRDEYKTKLESAADAVYKSKQSLEQMFAYDTAGYGRSNQGHTFGDSLTQTARRLLPRTSRPVCPNPEDPGGPRSESSLNRPNGSVAYQRRSDQNERLIATEGSVSIWLAR
jgi:cytochrome c peroxidase